MTVTCVWPLGALLGEGPVWHDGALWFVDIKSDRIHRFDPANGDRRSWTTPPRPGFLAPRRSGGFIVGLKRGLHDFDPASGTFLLRQEVDADHPGNRLNDGFVDAAGRLWFGTMDDAGRAPTGSLWRYDARGLAMMDPGYRITNGPAMSPDGRTLYHVDTLGRTIYAFDVDAGGALSNRRLFATVARGYPDGPAVDAEGTLWCALYGGWGIDRFAPDGRLIGHVALPCAAVTKAAFGGPDRRTLYVTTARQELSPAALAEQPLAGGLFALPVAVPGLPQGVFG
ncbi:SMP-30/gluconolactonase/LRE family protein [Sandaracinobacteroides saxicola]|uniref:SMP-30/gluconolactonase/LRE family protein n=1 Tax=Sandaracinobacteroides saxicola TaxID=2759707 RepID=A0A7G5IM52_9SPHN|nr:SMP-30/gluconolactonase/LRE family protein [Sandaracinobacteroides saxicola]QMW24444.1 SMP-30/gluconolactonase/LRE family protein [Sandaracinobacteroides saxicola]